MKIVDNILYIIHREFFKACITRIFVDMNISTIINLLNYSIHLNTSTVLLAKTLIIKG